MFNTLIYMNLNIRISDDHDSTHKKFLPKTQENMLTIFHILCHNEILFVYRVLVRSFG